MKEKQTQGTRWQRFVAEMRSTYKSMDTEEKWDIWVVRPIGFVVASICRALHIHPNAITIVSILFGAASGYFFFPGNTEMVLIGTLLLFFANTLDSADGQLARMTKQYTMLGRVLDGFAGDVWFFFIYLFIMLRMAAMPIPFTTMEWGWLSFVLVPVCAIIVSWCARLISRHAAKPSPRGVVGLSGYGYTSMPDIPVSRSD